MTKPDSKYDKSIKALQKWMACNKIFTTEQNVAEMAQLLNKEIHTYIKKKAF